MAIEPGPLVLSVEPTDISPEYCDSTAPWQRLQSIKAGILSLVKLAEMSWHEIARAIRLIERERLYECEANPRTGEPYASMKEYYPDLIAELRLDYNKRTLQQFVAVEKVLVENLGVTPEVVQELGPSRATALVEATNYDHRTGEVAEEGEGKKLGREQVLSALSEIRENDYDVRQTEEFLGETRGVARVTYHIEFYRWWTREGAYKYGFNNEGMCGIRIFSDKRLVGDTATGLLREEAEGLARRLGATSNLGDFPD